LEVFLRGFSLSSCPQQLNSLESPLALIPLVHKSRLSFKLDTELRTLSLGSAVGITTDYELHDRGGQSSSHGRVKNFTSPYRPDRLWGPSGLLFN
jgi:hypothetical protein